MLNSLRLSTNFWIAPRMLIRTYGDSMTSANVLQSLDDASATKLHPEDSWKMESIGVTVINL